MLATVFTVVTTHNLAFGVLVGVLLSVYFLLEKSPNFPLTSTASSDGRNRTYV